MTLSCSSPEDRRGRTWDVLEGDLCTETISSVDIADGDKLNVSSASPALSSTLIVIIVIVVVCVLAGGGFIAVKVMKKLRNSSELPVHYKVCVDQNDTVCLVPMS
jgi:hypothetical protein